MQEFHGVAGMMRGQFAGWARWHHKRFQAVNCFQSTFGVGRCMQRVQQGLSYAGGGSEAFLCRGSEDARELRYSHQGL